LIIHDGSKLIIDEIKLEARSKIRDIEKDSSSKIAVINSETGQKLKVVTAGILEDAKKRSLIEKKKIDAKTSIEISRRLGDARAEIIDECISSAFDRLKKTPPSKIRSELLSLLRSALKTASAREVVLISNKPTTALFSKKILRGIEKESGKKIRLKTGAMSGGIIVHDISSNMFVDYTFESLFRAREDEIRKRVSEILFS